MQLPADIPDHFTDIFPGSIHLVIRKQICQQFFSARKLPAVRSVRITQLDTEAAENIPVIQLLFFIKTDALSQIIHRLENSCNKKCAVGIAVFNCNCITDLCAKEVRNPMGNSDLPVILRGAAFQIDILICCNVAHPLKGKRRFLFFLIRNAHAKQHFLRDQRIHAILSHLFFYPV